MRLPALALCVALLATACGGDDGNDADGADTDVCDRLTLQAASDIVGVDYTANGQVNEICIYRRQGTDQAFALSVIAYEDDYDQVVADSEGLGYTAKRIRVMGADRAVALSGAHRSVVAELDGDAYEVTFNGDSEIAATLMTLIITGKGTWFAPDRVEDPCRMLTADDVRRLLGVPARAKAGTQYRVLKSCTWQARGRELVVAAGAGRGPVEEFWDENFFVGKGVEPEPVRVPGADGALLVSGKGDDTVGLAVARDELSYVVTAGGAVPDPRAAAIRAAALLLERS